jgi:uncharacterized protein (TIGR02246 family)
MSPTLLRFVPALILVLSSSVLVGQPRDEALIREVEAVERAFAQTMADRDLEAFASFLSEEAVFFSGPQALRGKQAVTDAWSNFFKSEAAPFSWQPETVEVLQSGTLALSTGPVQGPDGTVASTFTSIWRREADGSWKIVFDKGNRICDP